MSTITFNDGFSFGTGANTAHLSEEQLKECIASLNKKRDTTLRKIEYRREDIIRSLGVLTFDDAEMDDLLDNLSQIDREIATFTELLNASQNPASEEGKLLQLKRRIEVLKSVAQKMQEQN